MTPGSPAFEEKPLAPPEDEAKTERGRVVVAGEDVCLGIPERGAQREPRGRGHDRVRGSQEEKDAGWLDKAAEALRVGTHRLRELAAERLQVHAASRPGRAIRRDRRLFTLLEDPREIASWKDEDGPADRGLDGQ